MMTQNILVWESSRLNMTAQGYTSIKLLEWVISISDWGIKIKKWILFLHFLRILNFMYQHLKLFQEFQICFLRFLTIWIEVLCSKLWKTSWKKCPLGHWKSWCSRATLSGQCWQSMKGSGFEPNNIKIPQQTEQMHCGRGAQGTGRQDWNRERQSWASQKPKWLSQDTCYRLVCKSLESHK